MFGGGTIWTFEDRAARRWGPATGTDVVLGLHGLLSHSGWYQRLGESLAAHGHTFVSADRRGAGLDTSHRADVADAETLTSDELQLAQSLRRSFDRVHLVGWCATAGHAALLVHRSPKLFATLTLVAPFCPGPRSEALALIMDEFRGRMLAADPLALIDVPAYARLLVDESMESLVGEDELMLRQLTPRLARAFVENMNAGFGVLGELDLPIRVLAAKRDRMSDLDKVIAYFGEVMPETRVEVVDGSHAPWLTDGGVTSRVIEEQIAGRRTAAREAYTHGYSPEQRRFLSMRSAQRDADFLLPHLRPGMRVLDCGCGGGWLTVGLAQAVAPGEVVGFDREPGQIEAAVALATERKQPNVRFEVANVYELPFPDASFDAALAHTVLEHVSDPLRALKELRRVLKPGAVVGIKDPDYGTTLQEPATPLASEALSLYRRVSQHNGASPYYARALRRLLREAGFVRTSVTASALVAGDDQQARFLFSVMLKPWFHEPAFVNTVIEQGWADQPKLDAMLDALEQAFYSPDAFLAVTLCAAIAWVP